MTIEITLGAWMVPAVLVLAGVCWLLYLTFFHEERGTFDFGGILIGFASIGLMLAGGVGLGMYHWLT